MNLSNKKVSQWSLVLGSYLICPECSVVDRNHDRMRVGHTCAVCGHKADGVQLYFHINIMVIIDLLEESYFSAADNYDDARVESSNVAILIFFCMLKEALLEHLLNQIFSSLDISRSLRNRLYKDNRLPHEKINNLFPALVKEKWPAAIGHAGNLVGRDFTSLDELMATTANLRNNFLHDASPWDISRELSTNCIDSLSDIFELFVALHNHYVHRVWVNKNSI